MKKILTLSLFFAAALAVNSASAQERIANDTQDTTKVAPSKTTPDKQSSGQQDPKSGTKDKTKTDKSSNEGTGSGTRMAISEQGVVVDKKDKKKTSKTATNSNTNSTPNTSAPKK